MQRNRLLTLTAALGVAPFLLSPIAAQAANTVANPLCPAETAFFAPGSGQDINVPPGFTVSVFASGLNMPTGIAFQGNQNRFNVYVLESGHGLPSKCNEQGSWPGGVFDTANPFTPDIVVFDQSGRKIGGPLGKPTSNGGGFQPAGPAVDIAFERGFQGGRLFATDSKRPMGAGKTAARASWSSIRTRGL
jgi:glucose/arabinose dehydrogenase